MLEGERARERHALAALNELEQEFLAFQQGDHSRLSCSVGDTQLGPCRPSPYVR
jgi:hypothetical protein